MIGTLIILVTKIQQNQVLVKGFMKISLSLQINEI